MKRQLYLIIIALFSTITLHANGVKIDNMNFILDKNSKTATVTYTGVKPSSESKYSGHVIIPSVVTHKGVEYTVTEIGEEAFYGAWHLVFVTIPSTVKIISIRAFAICGSLEKIEVDPSNKVFDSRQNCNAVILTAKNELIIGCKGSTIPDGITSIGSRAFSFTHINSITIPSSVTQIGTEAFYWSELQNVTIPNSVKSIGAKAFSTKGYIKEFRYETGFDLSLLSTTVPPSAYVEIDSTGKIVKNETIAPSQNKPQQTTTAITAIAAVTAQRQNQTKSIPQNSCGDGLTWDYSAGTLTISGEGKMNDYSKGGAPWAKHAGSILYIKMDKTIFKIGSYAFAGCANVKEITIPNSVAEIGDYAFSGCKSLRKFSIPPSVKKMGSRALDGCDGLYEFMCPSSFSLAGMYIPQTCRNRLSYNPYNQSDPNYSSRHIVTPESLAQSRQAAATASSGKTQQTTTTSAKNMPLLVMVEGSIIFSDASKNNRIDADEQCSIRFKIQNNGKGVANRCEARVKLSGATGGISAKSVQLPPIAVGQIYEVNIPITSDINTQDGKVTIGVEVYEPSGWGIAPFDFATVDTKSYERPLLQVVDYTIASASGKIKKMEPFTLSFNLQNTQYGNAEQVKVKINLPANVFVMDGAQEQTFPVVKSGEAKPIQLSLVANNNYASSDIPVTIELKEKHGRFAENKQLSIALNQTTTGPINIAAKDEPRQERKEIQLATIGSAVDKNIPIGTTKNTNTFVVIIANENYKKVAKVPYALNDGSVFKQYCEKTLGIPSHNIHLVSDATYMDIKGQVNWLTSVMDAYQGQARIIFYYAGHGVPDEQSKTAFLLPVDGNGSDITTGYKLDNLYNALGSMPSERVTVFMDACFSGSKREEGMLASARGVAIKAKSGQPIGKMVVFSAATGDETAYPNNDEQHGMFTYYLLKKMQDTKGDVTLQDLGNYITTNVRQQSIVKNGKSQTPCVIPSATLDESWQNWKLK